MKLREPEPLGVLDHHRGGVRYIDPNLNHRRRDEERNLSSLEGLHDGVFLLLWQFPMHKAYRHAGQG